MRLRWVLAAFMTCPLVVGCGDESKVRAPADSTENLTTAPPPKNSEKKTPGKFKAEQ